jgi:hypothetical protein
MNRMRRLALGLVTLVALASWVTAVRAQQAGGTPPLKVTKIKENVYWAVGGAG